MAVSRAVGAKNLSRDSSPTRVFRGAEFADGDTSTLCVPTSLGSSWKVIMQKAVTGWQSWELPLSRASQFWRDTTPDPLLYSELRNRLYTQQGTGSEVLSLMATFPGNGDTWTASSQHTLCFSLWDSWLKEFGVASDFEDLQLSVDSAKTCLMQRVEVKQQEIQAGRLDRKYPGKLLAFVTAVNTLASSGRVGAWGLGQYIQSWRLYAQEGLSLHARLAALCSSSQTPALDDFLLCKALTEGGTLWTTLAFANHQIPELTSEVHRQLLPLFALASMATALYSDMYRFQRGSNAKSKSLNAAVVFDPEEAVLLHNSLFSLYFKEQERVLQQAGAMGMDQERIAVLQVVEVLRASISGLMSWQRFPLKFQGHVDSEIVVSLVPVVIQNVRASISTQIDSAVQRFVDLYCPRV